MARLKSIITFLGLSLMMSVVHAQSHEQATSSDFKSQGIIILDQVNNISGGKKQGGNFLALFDFSMDYHPGSGITIKAIQGRLLPELFGISIGSVQLEQFVDEIYIAKHEFETVLEFTFRKNLYKGIELQPDVQYILSPSAQYANAFVFLLRLKAEIG